MGRRDARVDDYIARAAEFAKPILTELRERVHRSCPGVEEAIKWGVPHFDYKGIMCSMAGSNSTALSGSGRGRSSSVTRRAAPRAWDTWGASRR